MAQEKIAFTTEDGDEVLFSVLEKTTIAGQDYLLVTENEEDEEAEVYLMKKSTDEDQFEIYEFVEDDSELKAISKVFEELLDDVDIEM